MDNVVSFVLFPFVFFSSLAFEPFECIFFMIFTLDINECDNGDNDCHLNASCYNVPGGYYCQCNQGFAGNGTFCEGKRSLELALD